MFDFFNEFFRSELVKNNIALLVIMALLILVIGAGAMWFYMTKIYLKTVENRCDTLETKCRRLEEQFAEKEKEFQNLKQRHDALMSASDKLRFMDMQYIARNTDITDSALNEFVNNL